MFLIFHIELDVGNDLNPTGQSHPARDRRTIDAQFPSARRPFRTTADHCDNSQAITLAERDTAISRVAEPQGRSDQIVQYGWKIESRAADRLQHLGTGRLLLESFAELQ